MQATQEQIEAVQAFKTGRPLKIAAFAGAGKTTTLKLLAESRRSRGVYLAFNKSIANEAKEKFPRTVECQTTHAIAYHAIIPSYQSSAKMTDRIGAKKLAEVMQYRSRVFRGPIRLDGVHQAHLVLHTVRRFCHSADPEFVPAHVPTYGRLLGAPSEVVAEVKTWALAEAGSLWEKMTNRGDQVPLGFDGFLKLWALRHPKIAAEFILLDEAQDTNGVVLGVLKGQDAQIVYVGDKHQQIYEWRGAINAMETITGCDEAYLTQSFRFGEAIASAASNVIATLGEARRIRGNAAVKSTISGSGFARCVLARTNTMVILEVLDTMTAGQKPCVVGGTKDLERLVSDVYELKKGKPGVCPEFFGFTNWQEVVAFADTEEGQDLRTFVQLVAQHGENALWKAIKSSGDDEDNADIILSTAHKAKGREWDSVRLASDFASSRLGSHPDAPSEVRLFYVAMTRARQSLIVAPELLNTFATEAWKTAKPDVPPIRQPRRPPEPSSRPQAPPQPVRAEQVREINSSGAHRNNPGRAPESSVAAKPTPPPQPTEPPHSSVSPQPPPHSKPRGFWGRLAKLFG